MKSPKYLWDPRTPQILPSQQGMFDASLSPRNSESNHQLTHSIPKRFPSYEEKTTTRNQGSSYKYYYGHLKSERIWKAVRQKRVILGISATNALLSWIATIVGYFVISMKEDPSPREANVKEGLKAIVQGISICQAILVAVKWSCKGRYLTIIRSALNINGVRNSVQFIMGFDSKPHKRALVYCMVECAFHFINFIPNVTLSFFVTSFGINSEFSLDDALYILIAARNYHTLELLYWCSKVSEMRTHLFAHLVHVKVTRAFIFRCYMAEYAWKIVVTVITAIVVIPGVIEYTFARLSPINSYYTIWSEYWIISFTQAPVGYGDDVPNTLFGEVSLIVSCFTGLSILGLMTSITMNNMDLNLTECNLYSELLYTRYKSKYSEQAAKLIQRWWRLMIARMRRIKKGLTLVLYYNYLREFRSLLTKCQGIKDRRFERQIDAFDNSTHKMFRPMNEYLNPIKDAHGFVTSTQVQDIVRNQYRIDNAAWKIYRMAKRNCRRDRAAAAQSSEQIDIGSIYHSNSSKKKKAKRTYMPSGQGLAKAKNLALHNVRGRLIRGESCSNSFALSMRTAR